MILKRHYVVLEKKFKLNIYSINEVIKQIQRHLFLHNFTDKLFSEENNVPSVKHCVKLERGRVRHI